eukprot:gene24427-biopygen13444
MSEVGEGARKGASLGSKGPPFDRREPPFDRREPPFDMEYRSYSTSLSEKAMYGSHRLGRFSRPNRAVRSGVGDPRGLAVSRRQVRPRRERRQGL